MTGLFASLVARDLRLAARRRADALLPIAFFTVAISLFPLGVGPEASQLRNMALEQMLIASGPGTAAKLGLVLAKAAAHWLLTGLPLVVAAPLFGLMFDMRPEAILALALTLLLGTPVLSLLGGLGAALTLGLRSGAALLILLIVPLCIPALIFGAGAVAAIDAGLSARGHYSLLGAFLIFTALIAPPATAAALRIATE